MASDIFLLAASSTLRRLIGCFAGESRTRGFVILFLMWPVPPGCDNFRYNRSCLGSRARYNAPVPLTLDIAHASISADFSNSRNFLRVRSLFSLLRLLRVLRSFESRFIRRRFLSRSRDHESLIFSRNDTTDLDFFFSFSHFRTDRNECLPLLATCLIFAHDHV